MKLTIVEKGGDVGGCRIVAIMSENSCPLLKFMANQIKGDRKAQKAVGNLAAIMRCISEKGRTENSDYFRPLRHKHKHIWEIVAYNLRVLCFKDGNELVICTHGFQKQSESTPANEIDRADACYKRYLEDKKAGKVFFYGEKGE